MRAIQVQEWGQDPQFTSVAPDPPIPSPDSDLVQIKILASSLPQLVRAQASGKHYSVKDVKPPYTPGSDGVGLRVDTNELVYFVCLQTGGGFAELINVPKAACFPLPVKTDASEQDKRALAVKVAGLVNPGMSSWMAIHARLPDFKALQSKAGGFNVLIIGATSISGKIAEKFCRSLGAEKVIGAARRQAEMDKLNLDATVLLKSPAIETDWSKVTASTKIDLVLDYIYGDALLSLLNSLPSNPARAEELGTQVVEIGAMSQQDLALPGALLRSTNITLLGAGPGSWSLGQLQKALPGLIKALVDHDFEHVGSLLTKKLDEVSEAWNDKSGRVVFVN